MTPRAALLLALALSCIAVHSNSQLARETASKRGLERRYLVRFSSRLFQSQQAELLRNVSSLTGSRHRYVYRGNSAAKLPSDYGVITTSKSLEELQASLGQFPEISGVFVDSTLRSLSSVKRAQVYQGSRVVPQLHQRLLQATNQSAPRSAFRVFPNELGRPLHAMGFKGEGIKVAVFDTGLVAQHRHFKNVKERTNWTHEKTLADLIGHGTFVAGVIASSDETCPGVAPEAELFVFRVFTKDRISYTSWFLDAFNYAMFLEIDVLNLSIGGPDYLDQPFVDKVNELTASGIIVVSAIGNDGPVFGSLNNPADQPDVIGVGGMGANDAITPFSSRGMTLSPLMRGGYGQVKPDVVTGAQSVVGSAMDGGCRELSGTSMASPVVAGAIALLVQSIPESKRAAIVNPASIKQLLHASARSLPGTSVFAQGAGAIDLRRAYALAETFAPHASIFPAMVSNRESNCPHMWPWCQQPIFHTSQPLLFNLTVLNSVAVVSRVAGVRWSAVSPEQQHVLQIHGDHGDVIWPWSGWLGVSIRVAEQNKEFVGVIKGNLTITLASMRDGKAMEHDAVVALEIQVIATPPRNKRLLWDQFHSIHYPSPYVPRDNLKETRDTFDWNGDHPHTNFARFFDTLRAAGFFVEVLGEGGWDCFDASNYAALLLVDPEDDFDAHELKKLQHDVRARGLGLLVVADWHEEALLPTLSFFDDNTRSVWFPVVGGANVPALNRLLRPFDAALGDGVVEGAVELGAGRQWQFASGTYIARWPAGGRLLLSRKLRLHNAASVQLRGAAAPMAALGLLDLAAPQNYNNANASTHTHAGRIAVMADSHCLDSASMTDEASSFCGDLAVDLLTYLSRGELSATISAALQPPLTIPYAHGKLPLDLSAQNYSSIVDVAAMRAEEQREVGKRMLEFVRYSKSAKLNHSSSSSSSSSHSNARCEEGLRARWTVSP